MEDPDEEDLSKFENIEDGKMNNEQQLATFEGYAIVEIMGHQKVSGYVTTQHFGGTAVFKVVQQELPPVEVTLESAQWIDTGERLHKGSRIRISRPRAETFVAAASLYRMTPCTEDEANATQSKVVEVLERAPEALLGGRSTLAADALTRVVYDDSDREEF